MKLGLNPIIYSVYSWLSLVLDLGNLPIKLGLPMFLNLRLYSVCSWFSLVLDLGNLPIKLGLPMLLNLRRYSTLFMLIDFQTYRPSMF